MGTQVAAPHELPALLARIYLIEMEAMILLTLCRQRTKRSAIMTNDDSGRG